MTFFVRISGLEIVTQKIGRGDEAEEIDVLKVTLKGLGEEKKTKAILFVDLGAQKDYPLNEKAEISVAIRQQRLPLDGNRELAHAEA